jgi:hypothetical protein
MATLWYGIKIGLGIGAGLAILFIATFWLRRLRCHFQALRFSRAGFTYEQNPHVTGWLSRDPENDDWILWDETHKVMLRSTDGDASWTASQESLQECLRIGREYGRRIM